MIQTVGIVGAGFTGVSRLLFNGYNSSFFSQLNAEIGAL
jgi:hypothetical protein